MRTVLFLLGLICIASAGVAGVTYLFRDNSAAPPGRERSPAMSGADDSPAAAEPAGTSSPEDAERPAESAPPETGLVPGRERFRLPYARATEPDPETKPEKTAREPLEIVRLDLPVARGAGLLEADGITVRMAGLDAVGPEKTCKTTEGKQWPCGRAGMFALRRLIRGRSVVCDIMERLDAGNVAGRCTVADTEINEWLVRQGWARPAEDNSELDTILEAAQRDKKGQWRDKPPWEE